MFHPEGPTFLELCKQALSSTREGYDLLAPKFDRTPFRTPDEIIERTLADAPVRVGAAVDLCTGTGAALPFLIARTTDRVVGVDFSAGMLARARERVGADGEGGPRVELVEKDLFDFDEPGAFDLVTCFGAFGHVPEAREMHFVDHVRKLLRRGGQFVFVTSEKPRAYAPRTLLARTFNGVMHVRNTVLPSAFVMYYLTFTLPEAERLLTWRGFSVTLHRGRFEGPLSSLVVVCATRT